MENKKTSCKNYNHRLNKETLNGCVAQRYEHYVDIVGVTGSIPVIPTNQIKTAFLQAVFI